MWSIWSIYPVATERLVNPLIWSAKLNSLRQTKGEIVIMFPRAILICFSWMWWLLCEKEKTEMFDAGSGNTGDQSIHSTNQTVFYFLICVCLLQLLNWRKKILMKSHTRDTRTNIELHRNDTKKCCARSALFIASLRKETYRSVVFCFPFLFDIQHISNEWIVWT